MTVHTHEALIERIRTAAQTHGRRMSFMEVCGTHTVSLFRSGVRSMLPDTIRMVSGPGCPVCVTAQGYIDAACALARRPGVTVATYGDMLRVPGSDSSLELARAAGARIEILYSARDAVRLAQAQPDDQVVFLAVGFETTTPATAATLIEARSAGISNLSILPGHKVIIPAMEALLSSVATGIDGFLLPGHVSAIIGAGAFRPIVEKHRTPCAVAGFEPASMLQAIACLAECVAADEPRLDNAYAVVVPEEGNPVAARWVEEVFEPCDDRWRALGIIPRSGLTPRGAYRAFDARERFGVETDGGSEPAGCRCGEVIRGLIDPVDCALFGRTCTPSSPVGPCMVSSEGACAAWFKYSPVRGRSV